MHKPYDLLPGTLTVSEASKIISDTVSELFFELTIEGEISGFRPASSGHWYFSLKDSKASMDAAVFRSAQYSMSMPANGDLVVARGSLSYYTKTGKLTFVIRQMRRKGTGDLLEAIEKRKDYYKSLGWFDEDKKKPLPQEIKTIGVVTSETGAAVRDVLNVTGRRAPSLDILIFPCPVQGEGAASRIASRIRQANLFLAADVLIVTRGGGSVEDLSCFSEPEVVEAIHESVIPVVTAIGHEIDWPIADFVADRRAPTPSAAAELVTETAYRRRERLESSLFRISSHMQAKTAKEEKRLTACCHALQSFALKIKGIRIPGTEELGRLIKLRMNSASFSAGYLTEQASTLMESKLEERKAALKAALQLSGQALMEKQGRGQDELSRLTTQMLPALEKKLLKAKGRLEALERETEALSPLSVLSRGYSVVRDSRGRLVKNPGDVSPGDDIDIRLAHGCIKSRVEDSYEL